MRIARHQLLGVAQAAAGLALVARPQAVYGALGAPDSRAGRRVARVLGARQVGQGFAVALNHNRQMIQAGGAVDALHALSMLPIVLSGSRWRRAAAASAAFASAAAVASRYAA